MRQRAADAHVVPVFLDNAQGFLRAGSEGPEPEAWAPHAQMLCCAIELALKAVLIASGWTDDRNRRGPVDSCGPRRFGFGCASSRIPARAAASSSQSGRSLKSSAASSSPR